MYKKAVGYETVEEDQYIVDKGGLRVKKVHKTNSNAMLIRDGRIKLIKTSDDTFKLSDIELYMKRNFTLKNNAKLGLTFAFVKGMEEETYDLNLVVQRTLKAPNFKSVMVIPTRLLKGVRFNE